MSSVSNWCSSGMNQDDPQDERSPPASLRYIHEFISSLRCSSELLRMKLFPDAKEVTESMGMFNSSRRLLINKDYNANPSDGIIVVGDGTTPRTAAMFAFRLPNWTCYSVDPMMRMDNTSWGEIKNLRTIRDKIQNIKIRVSKAIIILVHAHVSLDQALCAVEADEIIGLITLPCCNWYKRQEYLFDRLPDVVYDDYSILSDHREVRVWIGQGKPDACGNVIDFSASSLKGWKKKFYSPKTESLKIVDSNLIRKKLETPINDPLVVFDDIKSTLDSLNLTNKSILVLGDTQQKDFVNAMKSNKFTKVFSISDISTNAISDNKDIADLIIDVGCLDSILRETSNKLIQRTVADVGKQIQIWLLDQASEDSCINFICFDRHKILRRANCFRSQQLNWNVKSISFKNYLSNHCFIYICSKSPNKSDFSSVSANEINQELEIMFNFYLSEQCSKQQTALDITECKRIACSHAIEELNQKMYWVEGMIQSIRKTSATLAFINIHTGSDNLQLIYHLEQLDPKLRKYFKDTLKFFKKGSIVSVLGKFGYSKSGIFSLYIRAFKVAHREKKKMY